MIFIKRSIFKFMRLMVKVFCKKHCRIDSISQNEQTKEYTVTFVYIAKRQPFTKSVSDIINQNVLLNEFPPLDAALLGFYHGLSQFNRNTRQIDTYH